MSEEAPPGKRPGGGRTARLVVHVLALVAPVVPLGVTVGLQIDKGWRPTSDDAAIAWRTWNVFSSHAPLVGAFNDATRNLFHPVFDPGPLEYYLLAVPDRADPIHGILWGAALICAIAICLAVEAAWRAGGPVAAAAVSAGAVVLSATQTIAMVNLPWNPNIGVFCFAATLVLSAVAGSGRLGWWPVAVVTGSLATQSHLVFGPASLACLLVGLVAGIATRLRRPSSDPEMADQQAAGASTAEASAASRSVRSILTPVGLGILAGVLTMAAPIAQQLSASPGNLTLLVRNLEHQGRVTGFSFGLRAIDQVAGLPPAWARPAPPISGNDWVLHFLHALFGGSAAAGGAILAVAGAIAVGAWVLHRPGLAALSGTAAVSGLAMAWTFGHVALSQLGLVTYTDVALWPVGMALDACFVWAAAELVIAAARRFQPVGKGAHAPAPAPRGAPRTSLRIPPLAGLLATCGVLGGLLAWSLTSLTPVTSTSDAVIGGWPVARDVTSLAAAVERRHPTGPVLVEPGVQLLPGGLPTWSVTEALAYQLKIDGIDARLPSPMQPEIGPDAAPTTNERTFLVEPARGTNTFKLVAVAHARPVHVLGFSEHEPRR